MKVIENQSDKNWIEYSSTNTVYFSRSLAKDPTKLDPVAYKLSRHTDERHQILIFLSGNCKMVTDNYTHVLQPGDVCFNPAMSYYGVNILGDTPYERIVIFIDPSERFDALALEVFADLKPVNIRMPRLMSFIERCDEYSNLLPMKAYSRLSPNLIEELLYICLMEKSSTDYINDNSEALLKKMLAFIDANWQRIKNINEISNSLFISPSYMYEIFNKKLNIAPKAYLTQKRLQSAHAYLISGVSPNEVSQLVGFNTYTAFYRACKAFYGKTPQEIWIKSKPNT